MHAPFCWHSINDEWVWVPLIHFNGTNWWPLLSFHKVPRIILEDSACIVYYCQCIDRTKGPYTCTFHIVWCNTLPTTSPLTLYYCTRGAFHVSVLCLVIDWLHKKCCYTPVERFSQQTPESTLYLGELLVAI